MPVITVNSDILTVDEVPRGDFKNYDTGWGITSNSDGIGETANKEQKRSDSYHALKNIRSKNTKKIHLNVLGDGNYFSSSAEGVSRYGDNVMETYLSIKNPYVFRSTEYNTVADQISAEFDIERSTFKGSDVSRILKGKGYDGVILYDSDGDIAVANAFSPTQIKSATDNIGTFDATNPDIRYSEYDDTSMREVLSSALAEVTMTEAEARILERYHAHAKTIDNLEKELGDVNAEIKRLSFDKGKRDTARISELKCHT